MQQVRSSMCPWDLLLPCTDSAVVGHGLSICSVWAWLGILVPQPGIEPVSPALQGRFITPRPPGKSHSYFPFSCGGHSVSLHSTLGDNKITKDNNPCLQQRFPQFLGHTKGLCELYDLRRSSRIFFPILSSPHFHVFQSSFLFSL